MFLVQSGLSFALGYWLVLSAFSIFACQYLRYELAMNQLLDSYDQHIELDVHRDVMQFLRSPGKSQSDSVTRNGVFIPSPDLQDIVNKMEEDYITAERECQRARLDEERAEEEAEMADAPEPEPANKAHHRQRYRRNHRPQPRSETRPGADISRGLLPSLSSNREAVR